MKKQTPKKMAKSPTHKSRDTLKSEKPSVPCSNFPNGTTTETKSSRLSKWNTGDTNDCPQVRLQVAKENRPNGQYSGGMSSINTASEGKCSFTCILTYEK